MWDFMFMNEETGDEFFVECKSAREAWQIVWREFGEDAPIEYCGRYTVEEAEMIGLDTF